MNLQLGTSTFPPLSSGAYWITFDGKVRLLQDWLHAVSQATVFGDPVLPRNTPPLPPALDKAFYWGPEPSFYFFLDNIFDEVALAFRLRGLPETRVPVLVKALLSVVGLKGYFQQSSYRSPLELSGGEQQRLLAALVIARQPPVVIANEPLLYVAQDDRPLLYSRIATHLIRAGSILLLSSHSDDLDPKLFRGTLHLSIDAVTLHPPNFNPKVLIRSHRSHASYSPSRPPAVPGPTRLELSHAEWTYPDGTLGIFVESLNITAGTLYFLSGPNGAGKSSFVRLLTASYRVPVTTNFRFDGQQVSNPYKNLVRRHLLTFAHQDPNVHLRAGTVADVLGPLSLPSTIVHSFELVDFLETEILATPIWVRQACAFLQSTFLDAPLFLLDEPLDGPAFQIIGTAAISVILQQVSLGKTGVIISHNADLVKQTTHLATHVPVSFLTARRDLPSRNLLVQS
ncbi:MAG: ATP-binding cassette domain-containing protein [Verrucomicrobiae bacterium]|nr:ATP-binding cassette domain-containing protein [Verrucomicrobiae bacterium]